MSPREGFFETTAGLALGSELTGTLNALSAGATVVVGSGTAFQSQLNENTILTFLDTAGERQYYTIASITDDFNLTLTQPTRSVSSASTNFALATARSPYFIVRDALNLTYPLADPILGRLNYRLNGPDFLGSGEVNVINANEGITLNTIYIRNPYQHTWGDKSVILRFFQVDNASGVSTQINELGVNGFTFAPMENVETDVNIYIPTLGVDWGLEVKLDNSQLNQNDTLSTENSIGLARVSNVNVPTSMDGMLLSLVVGCRFTYGLDITE